MSDLPSTLRLAFNPFEPAASGPPVGGVPFGPPARLEARIRGVVDQLVDTRGTRAVVIIGDYGSGKTCLLRWLQNQLLPEHRIQPFYFDNPGVHFYNLANTLLRAIGRKDFAKFIWELAGTHVQAPYQGSLFRTSFEEYLAAESQSRRGNRPHVALGLQQAILAAGITTDDEIAHCLARVVADAVRKPYFEYRDFLPRSTSSLVAEAEEARYFAAILKTLSRGYSDAEVAFLIDEFEEIGLQKRLTKRDAHDYLATMKRLVDLAEGPDNPFWLFLSMTEDAYKTTRELEPALVERFAGAHNPLQLGPLSAHDAERLISSRLDAARPGGYERRNGSDLFPFPSPLPYSPVTRSNPRRLVKVCSAAVAAAEGSTVLPFSAEYLKAVEERLSPITQTAPREG